MASGCDDGVPLQTRVTCPNCWHTFPPDEILWIAEHPDLVGDPVLGPDEHRRFLPTRFTIEGHALDVKGATCRHLACPRCHLMVSRVFLEMQPLFFSILGAPSSGKSYLLTAMIHQLDAALLNQFSLNFASADPLLNGPVNRYRTTLFDNTNRDDLVNLPKTETQGDLYQSVNFNGQQVWYPKPFVFSLQPGKGHPGYDRRVQVARALCLYDNAGEHFLPDRAASSHLGTQHLSRSKALLFLFDPTQHPKIRMLCQGKSKDPQMEPNRPMFPQHEVLSEAARRIRDQERLPQTAKYPRPIIVIVTKHDAWNSLLGGKPLESGHVVGRVSGTMSALAIDGLQEMSQRVRAMLLKYAPEIVNAAESFSDDVTYVPVSVMGRAPELLPEGSLAIRPRDIAPHWAEIPILYALHRTAGELVRGGSRAKGGGGASSAGHSSRPAPAPPDNSGNGAHKETAWPPGKMKETGS